ncbi:MAG TPA: hypothetical protein VNI84_11960 [Pyrinomonadaceae bacterium]|nr:hypothetical protein [Pyrinomonadaceae bacterium]
MKQTKKITFIFSLSCVLVTFAFSQEKITLNKRDVWKSRADTITYSILKETAKIDEIERALLYAQIGDLWWKSDQTQSNVWFEKSVDSIFFYSSEDIKTNSAKYILITGEVLKIIADRNPKQSNRLTKILSEIENLSKDDKNLNADVLIQLAIETGEKNPQKAFQLGVAAFRVGNPTNYAQLLLRLRQYDARLSDRLFHTAFSATVASQDYMMMQELKMTAFPEIVLPDIPKEMYLPEPLKVETLNFFADYINQQQIKFTNKTIPKCVSEAGLVISLTNQFANLLPQKAPLVQQAINVCLANQNTIIKEVDEAFASGSIEELLSKADEEKENANLRGAYLFKAILLAMEQKKYALVIKILDGMSKEDRERDVQFWEEMRYESAGGLASIQIKENDLAGAVRTLNDVPTSILPFAQVISAKECAARNAQTYGFCVETLNNAQRSFIKSEKPFAEKIGYWLFAVKLFAQLKLNNEAAETFQEIAKGFNKSISEKELNAPIISSERIASIISADLLEAQENSLFESANLINEPKIRIQINLAFLTLALKEYEKLSIKPIKKVTPPPNSKAKQSPK